MNNKFTRSSGIIHPDMISFSNETGHFQTGGGLNLRGYAGYLAPEYDENGNLVNYTNYGTSGTSLSAEFDMSAFLPYNIRRQNVSTYLFADAGTINTKEINRNNFRTAFSDIRADAGIGFTYTRKRFGPLETIKPLIIRLDLPIFLNRPIYNEEYIEMRWLLGIGKSF